MKLGGHGRVYRSPGTRWAAVGGTAVGAVLLVIAATGVRGWVAVLVGGILMLLLAWRMWMVGIRVLADGVVVATVVGSRRFVWSEVDRFAVMALGRSPHVGYAVLRDGRKYGTFGLSTSVRQTEANRLRVQGPVDELNQILEQHRGSPATR
jgi:hypothetical protein